MKSILDIHIESGKFDHGYLLAGDFDVSREMAMRATRKILTYDVVSSNDIVSRLETNPDFFYQKYELFGIDESKDLIRKVSQRPFGGKKVFIIELLSFSLESANALLKTLEEPFVGTHFFILVPSLDGILSTLVSRLTVINNGKAKKELDEEKTKFYEKFLASQSSKRLETIKEIKEREEGIKFLCELELVVKSDFKALEEIQRSKNFLFSQGASAKMVLEHIALTLPKI